MNISRIYRIAARSDFLDSNGLISDYICGIMKYISYYEELSFFEMRRYWSGMLMYLTESRFNGLPGYDNIRVGDSVMLWSIRGRNEVQISDKNDKSVIVKYDDGYLGFNSIAETNDVVSAVNSYVFDDMIEFVCDKFDIISNIYSYESYVDESGNHIHYYPSLGRKAETGQPNSSVASKERVREEFGIFIDNFKSYINSLRPNEMLVYRIY